MRCILLLFLPLFMQAQKEYPYSSPEELSQELLALISLEPGEKMDTAQIRLLFHPQALISVLNPSDGRIESVGLNEFLEFLTDESYSAGFEEWELQKEERQFQGIAVQWQAFKGRAADGVESQGINSYQFVHYQGRWWIHSLLWTFDNGGGLEAAFE